MVSVLRDPTYRRLFTAQVVALLGTGLATIALGLLAFDLAGENAGAILGGALAIKMIAYVMLAPIAAAITERLPRRAVLVALDVVRGLVALCLPFVSEVWHVYVLIFLMQAASAAFTPTFQAAIPDILPDEKDYTKALSLSRLAYDLENLLSPTLAALLLLVVSFPTLFVGTAAGFAASALMIVSLALPSPRPENAVDDMGGVERTTRGLRIYLATPRLRGLLAICFAAAAAGSMVIVNTVVLVQSQLGLSVVDTALALAAFGCGSMIAALASPRLLEVVPDRTVMLTSTALMAFGLFLSAFIDGFACLAILWAALGVAYGAAQIPSGRLLRRSATEADRTSVFAAHFALSHACWLVAYPLAGVLGATAGLSTSAVVLSCLALAGLVTAAKVWPKEETDVYVHDHADLAADHPHWRDGDATTGTRHAHPFVIDRIHRKWPTPERRSVTQ